METNKNKTVVLAIETSCDETAISIIDASGDTHRSDFFVRADKVLSQIDKHREFGGVFPSLAKREHSKNLVPLLLQTLKESAFLNAKPKTHNAELQLKIQNLLEREPELSEQFLKEIPEIQKPPIDVIAVTYGPGLEPALWVGINFAKALALFWNIPLIPVNHMEGHIFSALLEKTEKAGALMIQNISMPLVALLVSGGHTELVLARDWFEYEIIGQTRDDAAGEAFDKVGRMLGLPYPGGPAVSALAETAGQYDFSFPRPMINAPNYDFSFSGLKTAVRYLLKDFEEKNITLDTILKATICHEFQNAVVDVLVSKTIRAAREYGARTILLGGGVSANKHLRATLAEKIKIEISNSYFLIPDSTLTGDNALMIAVAGFFRYLKNPAGIPPADINARGNIRLS